MNLLRFEIHDSPGFQVSLGTDARMLVAYGGTPRRLGWALENPIPWQEQDSGALSAAASRRNCRPQVDKGDSRGVECAAALLPDQPSPR